MNEAYRLNKEMEAATALREALATDDIDVLRDAVEGETNLNEMIASTVLSIDEDMTLVAALKSHIDELKQRHARIAKRVDTKRAAVEQAMVIAERKTLELPTMTVTLKNRPKALVVVDESRIPAEYWRDRDPSLDRKALLDALKDGAVIPGADLDNGGVALQMRRN